MQLGFVSAILPNQELEEVFKIASSIGYDCVEVMCWPPGEAERRYAGVTHIDVHQLGLDKIRAIQELSAKYSVDISALGYYPNPLTTDKQLQEIVVGHIMTLLEGAKRLQVSVVNTFIGRDQNQSIEDNWAEFLRIWRPILENAKKEGIKIGIENCPMSFTKDEWPGGQNLFTSPAIWRRAWRDLEYPEFGLNYDPSHMVIQQMNTTYPILTFPEKLHHIHAKDATIDRDKLDEVGVFAYPNLWHTPKLPGKGDVDWRSFFAALNEVSYQGAVCVEVEDRAYEGSLENRIRALQESHDFLRQFVPKK